MKLMLALALFLTVIFAPSMAEGQQYYDPTPQETVEQLNRSGSFDSASQISQRARAQQEQAAQLQHQQDQTRQMMEQHKVDKDAMGKSGLWFWGLLFVAGVVLNWAKNAYS